MTKPQKSHRGRPSVITDSVINLLEEAFMMDYSNNEACLYAGIGTTAYYDFIKRNAEYAERFETLKESPKMKAKKRIVDSLSSDTSTAKWYLERRSSEYSPKSQIDIQHTHTLDAQLLDTIRQYNNDNVTEAEVVDKRLLPDLG
ncbi:hypothetical protein [Desulfogranum marinum]|uniref:hypothetical protein n=1 Tax=Desulfogranum marinum TaxID=453220 RepID=UPI0019644EC8|nr:hypothetical protein [Desulfogranum marinum]MBM9515208.1 hypothetical protein [Desulfogranum marinum]